MQQPTNNARWSHLLCSSSHRYYYVSTTVVWIFLITLNCRLPVLQVWGRRIFFGPYNKPLGTSRYKKMSILAVDHEFTHIPLLKCMYTNDRVIKLVATCITRTRGNRLFYPNETLMACALKPDDTPSGTKQGEECMSICLVVWLVIAAQGSFTPTVMFARVYFSLT